MLIFDGMKNIFKDHTVKTEFVIKNKSKNNKFIWCKDREQRIHKSICLKEQNNGDCEFPCAVGLGIITEEKIEEIKKD